MFTPCLHEKHKHINIINKDLAFIIGWLVLAELSYLFHKKEELQGLMVTNILNRLYNSVLKYRSVKKAKASPVIVKRKYMYGLQRIILL